MTTPKHSATDTDRPEPVLDAVTASAKVSAAIKAVLAVVALVSVGVKLDDVDALVQAVVIAVGSVGAVVVLAVDYVAQIRRGKAARAQVTPTTDPVDDRGEPFATTAQLRQQATTSFADGKAAGMAGAASVTEADLAAARAAIAALPTAAD